MKGHKLIGSILVVSYISVMFSSQRSATFLLLMPLVAFTIFLFLEVTRTGKINTSLFLYWMVTVSLLLIHISLAVSGVSFKG